LFVGDNMAGNPPDGLGDAFLEQILVGQPVYTSSQAAAAATGYGGGEVGSMAPMVLQLGSGDGLSGMGLGLGMGMALPLGFNQQQGLGMGMAPRSLSLRFFSISLSPISLCFWISVFGHFILMSKKGYFERAVSKGGFVGVVLI
jgi:hypothetical protein